jgi:drug/metabolite transporter (DMT)-like permease
LPEPRTKPRRWNVILSGLLIATLAAIVIFTNRANFLNPVSVVVVAAIGLVALMLQLRFRYGEVPVVHAPVWLNALGTACAIVAFFGDFLHIRGGIAEVIALIAVGCFAVSGGVVLHDLRKRRALPK